MSFLIKKKNNFSIIFGSLVGNVMEFYDFVIFSYLSKYIGSNFFPSENPELSTLFALTVFSVGYLVRPLGAIFFGYLGDKFGRKKSLLCSIILMTSSTALIGLVPEFSKIGYYGSLLIILLRLAQGFSVSGEQGGIMVYLAEYFGMKNLGKISSLVLSSSLMGVFLGCSVVMLINFLFDEALIKEKFWRIPFLFSLFLGFFSYKYRKSMPETKLFSDFICSYKKYNKNHFNGYFSENLISFLKMFVLSAAYAVPISVHNTYLAAYYSSRPDIGSVVGLLISSLGLLWIAVCTVFFGQFSDKYDLKKIILIGCIFMVFLGMPISWLWSQLDIKCIILMEFVFCTLIGFMSSPLLGVIVKEYAVYIRYTGVSLSYNLGMSIFAGISPILLINAKYFNIKEKYVGLYMSLTSLLVLIFFRKNFRGLFYERV